MLLLNIRFRDNNSALTGLTNNRFAGQFQIIDDQAEEFILRGNILIEDSIPSTIAVNSEKLVMLKNEFEAPVQFADSKVATKVEIADNKLQAF
mgnify:CR=1 FL=1